MADASIVFTATTDIRRSVAASGDPGLKPSHPKERIKVPRMAGGKF